MHAYPDAAPNDYQIGEIVDHLVRNWSDFSDYYCRLTYHEKKSFISLIKRFLRLKARKVIQMEVENLVYSTEQKEMNALVDNYLISADEFYSENYQQRILDGLCRVYDYIAPPSANASEDEKKWYGVLLMAFGNGEEIQRLDKITLDSGDYGFYVYPGRDDKLPSHFYHKDQILVVIIGKLHE